MEETYIFDDFMNDSWDYVSEKVVDDTFWEDNLDLIKEITHDLHRFQGMDINTPYNPKMAGRIMESMFSNIFKHGIKLRK